jgi:hypothetical protein
MNLPEDREHLIYCERLAALYPHRAVQRMRRHAWARWWLAVAQWRRQ